MPDNYDPNLIVTKRGRLDAAITEIIIGLGPDLIDMNADELEAKLSENFVFIADTIGKMMPEVRLEQIQMFTRIVNSVLVKYVNCFQRDYLEHAAAEGNA